MADNVMKRCYSLSDIRYNPIQGQCSLMILNDCLIKLQSMIGLSFILLMIIPASSILYSLTRDYQITSQASPDQLGHIIFDSSDRQTGWNRLYIYTNPKATPQEQHRAAGFLQGYATYSQIHSAFLNFAGLDFKGEKHAPSDVQTFLDQQLSFMDTMVATNLNDPFWTYVGYYLQQVRYMHAGYMARVKQEKRSDFQLDFQQLYYLTSIGDLEDLLPWEKGMSQERKNCNAYIRLDKGQLFITHGTHNRFSFLLRIFKTWNFPRQGVPLQSTSFTSRPGDLISKDDFFLLSSGLRVLETSLANNIQSNLDEVKFTTVPSWLRTLVANHLASNISQWIQIFNTYRSGTHNNQWILIDPRQVASGKEIVIFFEEAFTLYRVIDMTPDLLANAYVAGYNTPITPEIYQKLGYSETEDGTYLNESRAIILKRYHPKMKTVQDMKYWLIANEEENIKQSLAPRWDLLPQKPVPFGMTDCKIASPESIREGYFWAISGPPTAHGRFEPFDWKAWQAYPHDGLQQSYNFTWIKIPLQVQSSILSLQ